MSVASITASLMTAPVGSPDERVAEAAELFEGGALTVAGAAAEFGLSRSVLYELMGSGRLAYSQVGRKRVIARKSLASLLARHAVGLAPHAAGR